jgi:DNA-binding MarR family transcriptional regulator
VTTADPVVFAVFNEIGIIDQLAQARLAKVLPDGLLVPHFTLLNHLVRVGDGRSPVDIARAFQITKGAVTNTLQRLESRGLIRLAPDPDDGRAKRVFLTPAGRAARERCIAAVADLFADIHGPLGDGPFAAALPFLRDLRQRLDKARD